jgi:lipopolysaccharide transport system ATP-binding protein
MSETVPKSISVKEAQPTIDLKAVAEDAVIDQVKQGEEMEASEYAIRIHELTKCFESYGYQQFRHVPSRMLKGTKNALKNIRNRLTGKPIIKKPIKGFWATKGISLDIKKGEVVGIIGRNGSGKTTLLKLITRVTHPTSGRIEIYGRISALLGVGTGFHPMFTGRQNVYMGGMVLGLTREEIDEKFDEIVAFSEIGDAIDKRVKYYSTGMRSRLGFAVAVQLQAEILLLDEVLAVGDSGFQKKCLAEIRNMRKNGRTILLVSHNTNAVKTYCDRCVLIEEGEIVRDGVPADVVSFYLSNMFDDGKSTALGENKERMGNGAVLIEKYWFEDAMGRKVGSPVSGEEISLCLQYSCQNPTAVKDVEIGIAIRDSGGKSLIRISTEKTGYGFESVQKAGVMRVTIGRLPLIAGEYSFDYRMTVEGEEADYIVDAAEFTIAAGDFFGTGLNETHSPVMVDQIWTLNDLPDANDIKEEVEAVSSLEFLPHELPEDHKK